MGAAAGKKRKRKKRNGASGARPIPGRRGAAAGLALRRKERADPLEVALAFVRNPSDLATREAFGYLEASFLQDEVSRENFRTAIESSACLNPQRRINLATALLALTKRPYLLDLCGALCAQVVSSPDPFNELFTYINHFLFSEGRSLEGFDPDGFRCQALWPHYLNFLDGLATASPSVAPDALSPGSSIERVVVMAPQILRPEHAPTRAVTELARCLATQGGHQVLVVDSCSLPPRRVGWVAAPFVAHVQPRPSLTKLAEAPEVLLASVPSSAPYDVRTASAVELARHFEPDVVFSYGNWNLAGDLLARGFPTVHHPSSRSTAMSLGHVYLFADRFGSPSGPSDPQTRELLPRQRGRYMPYRYIDNKVEAVTPTTRRALGLPDDKVLFALVGNRLPGS